MCCGFRSLTVIGPIQQEVYTDMTVMSKCKWDFKSGFQALSQIQTLEYLDITDLPIVRLLITLMQVLLVCHKTLI